MRTARAAAGAVTLAISLAALAAAGGGAAAATPAGKPGGAPTTPAKLGAPCTKPGVTGSTKTAVLLCAQSGGRLIWTRPAGGGVGSSGSSGGSGLGAPCPTAGATIGGGPGVTFQCARVGGKLVWTKMAQGGAPAGGGAGGGSTSGGTPGGTPGGNALPSASCPASSVRFTHSLIDPAQVSGVAPIGGQTGSGGVVAVRSYTFPLASLDGQRLPLFAPTDMTLTGASYYLASQAAAQGDGKPEYSLYFHVGCGISVNLFHVKALGAKLAAVVPKTPSSSSGAQPVTPTKVSAGEEIAYYVRGFRSVAFDFWVDDANHTNSFITPQRYGNSNYLHAVCPYSFYVEPLRSTWLAKLGTQSGLAVPGTPCGTVSQGQLGTAQGQWFLDKNPATGLADVISYDGTYMSQAIVNLESDGTVRIGGFWSPGYLLIGKNDPTWADPSALKPGSGHCWNDSTGGRSMSVQLDSATQMRVAVVQGPCPASVDPGAWKTYFR